MSRRTRGDIALHRNQYRKKGEQLVFVGDEVQTKLSEHLNTRAYLLTYLNKGEKKQHETNKQTN